MDNASEFFGIYVRVDGAVVASFEPLTASEADAKEIELTAKGAKYELWGYDAAVNDRNGDPRAWTGGLLSHA